MLLFLLACSGEPEKQSDSTDIQVTDTSSASDDTPKWYGDIQPMVAENCTTCHHDGGSSPFTLETYEQVRQFAPVMLSSMQTGSMPPWLPDTSCLELDSPRVISSEQIDRFSQWIDQDMPEGDASLGVTPYPTVEDISPTITAQMPTGFTPNTQNNDQYRCFVLDMAIDKETFVTQTQVTPGSSQVHHVLVYALHPELAQDVINADGSDGQVGYSCFGAPFPPGVDDSAYLEYGFPTQIGAWVPGIEPAIYPDGTALRIQPNAVVVMQIHYSALGGEPTEDSTAYHLVTTEEPPQFVAEARPLAIRNIDVPAGTIGDAQKTFTNYSDNPITIRSLSTHMHLLGKEQHVTINRNDGTEECALYIDDWDFSWQQAYKPVEQLELQSGESFDITCTFDNTAENQPFVDGEQLPPEDVKWGDGTLDEMCILYASFIEPYRPSPPEDALACYGSSECGDTLDEILSCDTVDTTCLSCTLYGFFGCGLSSCGTEAFLVQSCLLSCASDSVMMGSPIGNCLANECPTEYQNLMECAEPVIKTGACTSLIDTCGLPF